MVISTKHPKPSRGGAVESSAVQQLLTHRLLYLSKSWKYFTEEVYDLENGGHYSSRFTRMMRLNAERIGKWKVFLTVSLMLTMLVPTLTIVRRRLVNAVSTAPDGKYTEYRVVVDAGSSGTRAFIYGFKGKNDLKPDQEQTDAFDGGLDTNVACFDELNPGDWEEGRSKLVKICKTIFKNIDLKLCEMAGKGKRFNTPVTVKFLATEGMRTYNRRNGAGDDALMRTIRSECKHLCEKYKYQFLAAEILHGKLEAMAAWVDANCRYPNDDGTPVGIMEVGGASMQIMTHPGPNGIYCNASFGKDAAMRTIVEKLNESIVKRQTELEKELSDLTEKSRRKHTRGNRKTRYRKTRSDQKKLRRQKATLKKLRTKSCPWNFVEWTGKACDHPIFAEGAEKQLKELIDQYLFTAENIADFKRVTQKRTPLSGTGKVMPTTRNLNATPLGDKEIEATNKKILARDCKRNYLLACSFEHLERELEGNEEAKSDPSYNFFDYIEGIDVPTFTAKANNKFIPSNRFMFFFAKRLYQELKENIDVRDTKTPPPKDGIMWTRGIALMQTFDTNNDTELNGAELKKLIESMRSVGFCKGFFSM